MTGPVFPMRANRTPVLAGVALLALLAFAGATGPARALSQLQPDPTAAEEKKPAKPGQPGGSGVDEGDEEGGGAKPAPPAGDKPAPPAGGGGGGDEGDDDGGAKPAPPAGDKPAPPAGGGGGGDEGDDDGGAKPAPPAGDKPAPPAGGGGGGDEGDDDGGSKPAPPAGDKPAPPAGGDKPAPPAGGGGDDGDDAAAPKQPVPPAGGGGGEDGNEGGDEANDPARPPVDENGPLPEVVYDLAALPQPVMRMRELIIEACKTGDPEKLRPLIGTGDNQTRLAFDEAEADPIEILKQSSGDGEGQEILAILLEVLEAGFVHLDAGKETELYVWPYFFALPLEKLTTPQRVELFKLITAGDYEDMKGYGAYIFYRVGITPDGRWDFFLAGD